MSENTVSSTKQEKREIQRQIILTTNELDFLKDVKADNNKKDFFCILLFIVAFFFIKVPFWTFVLIVSAIYFISTRRERDNLSKEILEKQHELEKLASTIKN